MFTNERYNTHSAVHTAAEAMPPICCGSELSAAIDSAIPSHAHARNTLSLGKKYSRLGDARNGTACTQRPTGSSPCSPRSGTNCFAAAMKATRKKTATASSNSQREYQYSDTVF